MSGEQKVVVSFFGAVVLVIAMIIGYNLYENSENRKVYLECIKTQSFCRLY